MALDDAVAEVVGQRDQDHALIQGQISVGHPTGFRVHRVVEAEIAVQRIALRQLAQIGRGRRWFGQQRQAPPHVGLRRRPDSRAPESPDAELAVAAGRRGTGRQPPDRIAQVSRAKRR